ncbi:hypothetical protein [Bartonella gliris]|uniref:hypothetical protein n=1 Tax=Bartonella gliris TaxID=3004109 RepID=UPI00295E6805|nr:hypothetical protein [Bartonella gliris]
MNELITRRDEEISDEEQPTPPTKEYGVLKYALFIVLLDIRGHIKGILTIIKKISFFMLFWGTLVFLLFLEPNLEFQTLETKLKIRIAFTISLSMWIILGFGAMFLSWFYDILLLRLAPPDIDFALFD